MTYKPPDDPRSLIRYTLAGLALTVIVLWVAYQARDALLVIYISILVAIGLSPLVARLEQRRARTQRLPRWAAILSLYVVMVGAVIGVAIMVVPPLVEQARELWAALPMQIHQVQQWLLERGWISRELTVQEAVQRSPVGGDAVGTVLGAVWGLVGGVFGVVTILILAFYLLVDFESLLRFFIRLFPHGRRQRVRDATHRVTAKVSAWLGGQILLATIIGSSAALGLGLMGVPYFYVLALLAAFGEMIPIVGPVLSAIPAVLVALTVSPQLALGVIIFFVVQQQIENHLLVPKIMSRQVGISPVVVISALMLGGSLLGIVGAILAVPTAAILQVVFEEVSPNDV